MFGNINTSASPSIGDTMPLMLPLVFSQEVFRKLFVHRNTLVYRLEKIKKLTGLDLREFDDAITFKVALMVKKYLTSRGIDS